MSFTKTQRRRRALRRAAIDLGVGGLFFYYYIFDDAMRCSKKLNTKRSTLIDSPGMLKSMLNPSKDTVLCDVVKGKSFKFFFEDDGIEFENIDELKKYLLIKRISGIE